MTEDEMSARRDLTRELGGMRGPDVALTSDELAGLRGPSVQPPSLPVASTVQSAVPPSPSETDK
jgi:hypothetical protein